MGRRPIDRLSFIQSDALRSASFSKNKSSLFNQAFEISQMCGCSIAVLILTGQGIMHNFSSDQNIRHMISKYTDKHTTKRTFTISDLMNASDTFFMPME